jgi:hypothetical protein
MQHSPVQMPVADTLAAGTGAHPALFIIGTVIAIAAVVLGTVPYWAKRRTAQDQPDESLVSPPWVAGLLGFTSVLFFALGFYVRDCASCHAGRVAAVALLIAAAALMLGFLFGFLFGIPRSGSQRTVETVPGQTRTGETTGTQTAPTIATYRANTNLEEISDWLTKILVGAGLAELGRIEGAVDAFSRALENAFDKPSPPGIGVIGVATALYFLVTGFLYGYVWSRVVLPLSFTKADRQADQIAISQRAMKS